ncbi:MAG TPA: ATP-binding cassette domain-containing protein [Clostridia bacterium]
MEKVLQVANISKKYKNGRGIKNISFDIYEGEVVGLIGPNGSGKTTVMKSIASLIKPDTGEIHVLKTNMEKDFEKAISNIGCLIETPALICNMTCFENLKIVSRFYDLPASRIDEVLGITGLLKYKNEKVGNFSLGMKQKLALGMAIFQKPKLVILDEPSNGLDIEASKELRQLIGTLSCEFMISFLISSHQIHDIELLCNRILIINDGRIMYECDVNDVLNQGIPLEDYYIQHININK